MLRSRRPSSSLRPRRPLRGAAAAEAERSARRQRRERLQRARPEGPGAGSALPRAWGAKPQPRTPRDARSPGAWEPQRSPPRQVSCSFPKFALQHLRSSSCVLLAPSLLCAPPPPALPPGRWGWPPSLLLPSGGFLDQVVVPIGRRGGEAPGEEGVRGQSGSNGRGRSWAGAGRLRGGRATREAARRAGRREALEGWRGPRAREAARDSARGRLNLGCGSPRWEVKSGGRTRFPAA